MEVKAHSLRRYRSVDPFRCHGYRYLGGCSCVSKFKPLLSYKAAWELGIGQAHHGIPRSTEVMRDSCSRFPTRFTSMRGTTHIHRHNFPLAVPAATQSLLGWKTATAGTAVIPPPPSCANCSPFALYKSTKRFILPMQSFWTPSGGLRCHCGRRLETRHVNIILDIDPSSNVKTYIVTHLPV